MDYDIPALDALTNVEKRLTAELDAFRLKMDLVETQMDKALDSLQAAHNALGGAALAGMAQKRDTIVMTAPRQ